MPHLSPMNWPLSSILFMLVMIATLSTIWWHPRPNFPPALTKISPPSELQWPWS